MQLAEPIAVELEATPSGPEEMEAAGELDYGADMSDEELGDLLIKEVTIDGMCGVY